MSWSDDAPGVLVAAISGRAIAAAARRDGFAPLVADLFGDLDTIAVSDGMIRMSGTFARGIRRTPLLGALDRLADKRSLEGVVYGSGFEDRPALLDAMARRYLLIGNPGDTVAGLKDPFAFAELCRRTGVPHPQTRPTLPARGEWLEKRSGGAGGFHVQPATPGRAPRRGRYYQRHTGGRSVSVLFLADGRRSLSLGLNEQWADPEPGRPFRYGGAVRPAAVPDAPAQHMIAAVARLTSASGLVGLCGADFLLRSDGFDLLEINPRPGATLDIYRDAPLFRYHVEACRGRLPDCAPVLAGAQAAAVVYARAGIRLPDGFTWPEWTADRQPPGDAVPAGAPLCTVIAEAADADMARHLAWQRGTEILALAGAAS